MASIVQSEQQKWNAARKKRNQSRFIIRERIKLQSQVDSDKDTTTKHNTHLEKGGIHDGRVANESEIEEELNSFLKAITQGGISSFSLQVFSTKYDILSKPFPTDLLSRNKMKTLCRSRFSEEYANTVLNYTDLVNYITMFEYALLLGEFGVAQSFISGGINPCDLLHQQSRFCFPNERVQAVAAMVMKKLVVDFVPTSLAVYISKRIYEMRLKSIVSKEQSHQCECELCSSNGGRDNSESIYRNVSFPCCNHIFCEVCLWENLVGTLDERIHGDVVQCPLCDMNKSELLSTSDDEVTQTDIITKSIFKRDVSLQKFQMLPKTSIELRKLPKRRNMKKKIYSTWRDALQPTVGLSQDVRSDKFKRYVERGAIHHCRACLEEGVDINMPNEYQQTPLYIACWRNHVELVKLLLEWGANVNINANGLLSALNVAIENKNYEIVTILNHFISVNETSSIRGRLERLEQTANEDNSQLTMLIQDDNHPGHGAFFIDHLFAEETMSALDALFLTIPIADATEVKQKKIDNNIPCSLRHYFCDAEGYLCNLISNKVQSILLRKSDQTVYKSPEVFVFPHMRFLNYNQAGGELLPHVDLNKVDAISGQRSSHTFILYLRNCELGGETALLKELSGSGPKEYHEIIEQICPQRSRLLVFPHACPHQGMKVISTPKILLRGEMLITNMQERDKI